jgi:predicted metal-binding membrane protein
MTHLSADTRPRSTGPWMAGVAAALSRPRWIAMGCMAALTASGWAYLLLTVAQQAPAGTGGFLDAMCRAVPIGGSGSVAVSGTMWVAMTLAMMLPTAGPMVLTYAEIWRSGSASPQWRPWRSLA